MLQTPYLPSCKPLLLHHHPSCPRFEQRLPTKPLNSQPETPESLQPGITPPFRPSQRRTHFHPRLKHLLPLPSSMEARYLFIGSLRSLVRLLEMTNPAVRRRNINHQPSARPPPHPPFALFVQTIRIRPKLPLEHLDLPISHSFRGDSLRYQALLPAVPLLLNSLPIPLEVKPPRHHLDGPSRRVPSTACFPPGARGKVRERVAPHVGTDEPLRLSRVSRPSVMAMVRSVGLVNGRRAWLACVAWRRDEEQATLRRAAQPEETSARTVKEDG
jgi:hypothetical protein